MDPAPLGLVLHKRMLLWSRTWRIPGSIKCRVLSPTSAQYQDFSSLHTAETLDRHHAGVIKVNRPEEWYEEIRNPLLHFLRKNACGIRFNIGKMVFRMAALFCKDTILPSVYLHSDGVPAPDLVTRMETLWRTSNTLNDCRYLPDIDIKTPVQHLEAGLPPTCIVWPNVGDQLAPLPVKTPGLHSPTAYVAGKQFGAGFNCHRLP